MDKFKMELTWHNCLTYPPKEARNNNLYITDGNRVFLVVYGVESGWRDEYTRRPIPQNLLKNFWWADIVQTAHETPEFKEV